ncbi:MAG: lysophospholipid acyltransferase family protein [Myxococcales bacterium]|nr:1-acyl-sn-glycerol-3-phosphate acyltransferase [Polyangiaceae bacterium]MDW8250377.1 lysophospholipid acyltransferase family protein [Myxococcales bacterium]
MVKAKLRQVARAVGFGVLSLGAGTGVFLQFALSQDATRRWKARDAWTRGWSRSLLRLFDVQVQTRGNAGIPGVGRGQGRIVVANHRSIIDIAVLLSNFGGAMISRSDIERWPIIGYAARSAGTIFVDRSSKESGSQAIAAMVERLRSHDTICIFPEGTTFEDDEVRPFRVGAFVAAQRVGVPVIPVGLAYPLGSGAAYGGETFLAHLARLAASQGTAVYVEIGDELRVRPGEEVEGFAERCRQEVQRLVLRARERERIGRC